MKKAIGDNMIPREWGFERGLELIKKAGYDGIELWLGDVPWFQMATSDGRLRMPASSSPTFPPACIGRRRSRPGIPRLVLRPRASWSARSRRR